MGRRALPLLALGLVGSLACDPGPGSASPGEGAGEGGSSKPSACAPNLIAAFRDQRLSQSSADLESLASSYAEARGGLERECESGCAVACTELGRTHADLEQAQVLLGRACELGSPTACGLRLGASPEEAKASCEAGEFLACPVADAPSSSAVAQAACADHDVRGCASAAWLACAASSCDERALGWADEALVLAPTAPVVSTFAASYCAAGQGERADEVAEAMCSAGVGEACGRRCVQAYAAPVFVAEGQLELAKELVVLIELQSASDPSWTLAMGLMSAEALEGYAEILRRFTPKPSEPGAAAKIDLALREQFPTLVAAIERAPQLDAKKIRYWLKRLPDMTEEQRTNLLSSLRKQWWMIAEDGATSPADYVAQTIAGAGLLVPG